MNDPSEVVITGIGMLTTLGVGAGATLAAWRSGAAAPRTTVPELRGTALEGFEVVNTPDVSASPYCPSRRTGKFMSTSAQLGSAAAREAVLDAGMSGRFVPERIGLYAATGLAAVGIDDTLPMLAASVTPEGSFSTRLFGSAGLAATNPLLSFRTLANMPACLISIAERIKGPSLIFTPWEAQGGAALEEAWRAVRSGEVDGALAGAADDPVAPCAVLYLAAAGVLAPGQAPGSGGAYVFMERMSSARRDGRPIYAWVADMHTARASQPARDPLADLMGRTFAAAPAILTALTAAVVRATRADQTESVSGVDGAGFHLRLRAL